jgi:predicted dehydrogenase
MGYMDATLNLFADFYTAVKAKKDGQAIPDNYLNSASGHAEMRVLEAAIKSRDTGAWTKVGA